MTTQTTFGIIGAVSYVLVTSGCLVAPPVDEASEATHIGASDDGAQDDADDDKAGPAFAVEADAPDAQAVLLMANTFSVTKLVAAGVTKKVAKNIYNARTANGGFATLEALDKVPFVGIKVFAALRWHATIKSLYPTSLRMPTLTADGAAMPPLVNEALVAAGFAPLAAHVWIHADRAYTGLLADWAQRFDEAELGDEVAPLAYVALQEFAAAAAATGAPAPCWIGNPWHVAKLLSAQTDGLLPDDYTVVGWRVGNKTVLVDELPNEAADNQAAWDNYDQSSNELLVMHTTAQLGVAYDHVPACRNPR